MKDADVYGPEDTHDDAKNRPEPAAFVGVAADVSEGQNTGNYCQRTQYDQLTRNDSPDRLVYRDDKFEIAIGYSRGGWQFW